jgi:TolB protein
MKKSVLLSFCLIIISFSTFAQIGLFDKAEDIGKPKLKGSSTYDETSQTYTMKGGGENIWFNHDEFQFLYKKIKGDFLMTANFELIGNEKGNGHRKTGWMIRESNQHDAVSVNACVHGDGLAVLQWRLMRGAYMRDPEEEVFFPKEYFGETIVELERIGKKNNHAIGQAR